MTPSFSSFFSDKDISNALDKLNFTTPTDIQAQAIPVLLQGSDAIIQARTGSGKTLAYSIPLIALSRGLEHVHQSPRVIVLTPTRELATQVRDVIASVTEHLPEGRYETPCIIGGADMDKQIQKLERDCRIVVATPGRMLDLMRQKKLKLNACRFFALDEADEMLSSGFLEDIRIILSKLPDKRQGVFVSATITPRVEMLANSFLDKTAHIAVDSPEAEMPPIEHLYADVAGDLMAKPNALCDIIETYRPASAIVFCNTKSDTQLVEALLRRRGFEARRLNSDLSQRQRERVMKKIRSKELPILVATDIAARGLDIEALDMVINFSLHDQPEIYVHRTGRTGRAGRSGIALSLVGPRDFGSFHFITKVVKAEFKKIELPTDSDIAEARLAHLSQMLRESQLQIGERDRLIAEKFLLEGGISTELPEELIETVAKLCRHMMEHHVSGETKALEEELASESEPAAPREGSEDRGDRRDRKREKRERSRDERRDYQASDETEVSSSEAKSEASSDEGNYSRHNERSSRPQNDRRGDDRSSDDRRRDNRRGEERRDERVPTRVFIGQGQAQGISEEELLALIADLGEIGRDEVSALIIRDNYSVAELNLPQAKSLVKNLDGMSYNGMELKAEIAVELHLPKHNRQNRGHGRRGESRRGGHQARY